MGFKGAPPNNRYIVYRIKDATNAIVYPEANLPTSGAGYINNLTQACNGPNALLPPPANSGYDAILWTPENAGTFYIEFSLKNSSNNNYVYTQFNIDLFDITIYDPAASLVKPGRLYSKCWQFSETNNFSGINYILSDDGIVTSAQFNDMNGGAWIQYANQTGCGNTNWMVDRNSLYNQQALFPQYKTFLNSPDPAVFPIATTLGQIVPPDPSGTRYCDGHIDFLVNVDKPGNVEIDLNFIPSTYITRVLNQAVTAGANTITWDGKDDNGIDVPNNVQITFTVKYINGLTNLPLYDVEGNSSGFLVQLISPAGAAPHIFWNDSIIWAHPAGGANSAGGGPNNMDVKTNVSTGGCLSPATFPGCHKWNQTQHSPPGDWGNLNTINSWWYTVSTSTTYPPIYEWRSPELLVFQTPPQDLCAGASGVNFTVNSDPNTEQYHWAYTGTGATFIPSAVTATNSVTVNFAPDATSGNITVYGTNTNCNSSPSPTVSLSVTIHPNPLPTVTGNPVVCNQSTGNVYTTETGMTNYVWSVIGGMISGGGGSGDNTVTVTWTTAGTQTVSVSYTNSYGCSSAAPTVKNVIVNPLPVPTFTAGDNTVCLGTPGHVYSTEIGKSAYAWTIAGGIITAGGTASDNTATVTWNTTGPQSISVNYTDVNGCTALSPTIFNVTVNPLPIPSFTGGDAAVCLGTGGHIYTTQAGMPNYNWNLTGGTITAGGGTHDNTATVTWTSPGTQTISINYNDPNGCIAVIPAIMTVTVSNLPVPTISGNATVCNQSTGNVYTTETGMTGYTWLVTGGTVTAGGTSSDNSATVTWTAVGNQTISVNYNDPNGCTAASPTVKNITVKPLPNVIATPSTLTICSGFMANIALTSSVPGTTFAWNVPSLPSGVTMTQTSGTGDIHQIINNSNTTPAIVNFSIMPTASGCPALTPTIYPVTVNPLPIPTVSGPQSVCFNSTQSYSTQASMTGYSWIVTGGSIVNGGTTNTISIHWTSSGLQTITVNYIDANGCTAVNPGSYSVTVHSLPVPVIAGPAGVCLNTSTTYSTQSGMTGYSWTVTGGTFTSGGTSSDYTATVLWNTLGWQTITVNYTDGNGCTAASPSSYAVQVNTLPLPTITGSASVCAGSSATYTTESGMSSYTWHVSAGGTIISGIGTMTITVLWNTIGAQTVDVNYVVGTGCTAPSPTVKNITVNAMPAPVITGPATPCGQSTSTYTVGTPQANYSYLWTVTGGTPVTGTSSSINVTWGNTNPVSISMQESITYPGAVCISTAPAFPVTLVLIPDAAGAISGPSAVCQTLTKTYTVAPINNSDSYTWWYVPSTGVAITNNGTSANLLFDLTSSSGNLYVKGNKSGCASGPSSPAYPITVNTPPYVSLSLCNDSKTTSSSRAFSLKGGVPPGGQYYIDGNLIISGIFDPGVLSTTSHQITYSYTDHNTCVSTSSPVSITIIPGTVLGNCPVTFTDPRDNKTYRASMMGARCWMLDNLTYGNSLTPVTQDQTDNCTPEKYCLTTDPSCTTYGGLYQWDELMQYQVPAPGQYVQGLCPPEWHVPTQAEWQLLIDGQTNPGNGIAGADLKDPIPAFGFRGFLDGIYYQNNYWAFISGSSLTATMFWTSTNSGTTEAVARGLNIYNPSVSRYVSVRSNAFPVRCVKD